MKFDIESRTIYLARHGSHAYGTNLPTSDIDVKGICIPPLAVHFGFLHTFEQYERMGNNEGGNLHRLRGLVSSDCDLVIYSLKKFAKLAADCNPNIIEVLFCSDEDVLEATPEGEYLRSIRERFLSKKAKHTFSGYAHAQLKRIKTHRGWLLNPPMEPSRGAFGLSEKREVSKSDLGAYNAVVERGDELNLPPNIVELLKAENAYAQAQRTWQQYLDWQTNRNSARHELEAQFGYDTKHAMHLIRLMRMCREILLGKGVIVKRPDAEELLEIRAGRRSYEDVVAEAESLNAECDELYKTTSYLPHKPDVAALDAQVVEMTLKYHFRKDFSL